MYTASALAKQLLQVFCMHNCLDPSTWHACKQQEPWMWSMITTVCCKRLVADVASVGMLEILHRELKF